MSTSLILGLAALVLPSVGGAVAWATARYVKQQWLRDLINAITSNAVTRVENEIVKPIKTDPAIANNPDGTLTAAQAARAKQAAMNIATDALSTAGVAAAPHVIGAAIEEAVAKLKPASGADLPTAVKAGLPGD